MINDTLLIKLASQKIKIRYLLRAVIPAAGFGTRLKPHTFSLPKVLLNVGSKPILGHIIDKLLEEKISKATFVIGYLGEKIVEYVRKHYPELKADFVEQKEMLGLGHAIFLTTPTFDDEEIFIILGDTVFDVNLAEVFKNKTTSLGVKEVDNPGRFGVAVCDKGKIIKLIEKPEDPVSKLALVGLYYVNNSKVLQQCLEELLKSNIRTQNEFQLTDAFQLMIDKGETITTFPVEGWYDCGKPETLLSTNKFLLSKSGTNRIQEGIVINDPVYISEKATIKNSVIGPYTTIASNCVVSNSIIVNSIISPGAVVDKAMLESSIIGSDAVIKGNYKKLNTGDSSEIEYY